jgi:hypothetical protein
MSELDNFIAEKVMGWKLQTDPNMSKYQSLLRNDESESIACSRYGDGAWNLHDGVGGSSPFTPSEWPEHCAMLKERLRELGVDFNICWREKYVQVSLYEDALAVGRSYDLLREHDIWYNDPEIPKATTEEMAVALFVKALVEAKVIP